MNPQRPAVTRIYMHVWWLDNRSALATGGPDWGWVVIGPRGTQAGVEREAGEASQRALAAAFLMDETHPRNTPTS